MALNGNTLPYVPPAASAQQQIRAINQIIDIINTLQQQIIFADANNKRMFIGYQKDGWGTGKDFGIKISVPGVDVMTASDTDLLFKMDGDTWSWNNGSTKKNFMQVGLLPDGTFGFVVAKEGNNVKDAF